MMPIIVVLQLFFGAHVPLSQHKKQKGNTTSDGLEHKMTMINNKQMTRF
jgi:hypothetical protein